MQLTRDRAGQPWRARQRDFLSRIVRETEPPTDAMPRITDSERRERDDAYYALIGEVLDLAGNIGAILMASGTPATATMDQVSAIATAYGIERCEVDVINTTIHVAAYRGPTMPAASALHIVQSRSMDFSRLAAVDRLIGRIKAGQVSPSTAREELDVIITAPHPYKRWIATLAWGALAFATAGTLGADLLVCLVGALSAMAIDRVNRRLNKHGLPFFFQYAVGGAIATAPPILLYALSPKLGFHFDPTVAIAAGLVVLLAGLSLVGSVGDVISGAPVTAAARFFELVMLTAATIAGVAFVLHLASRFGAPSSESARPHRPPWQSCPHVSRSVRSRRPHSPWLATRRGLQRWLQPSAAPQAPSCSFWRRARPGCGGGVVCCGGADRPDRPADGAPQSRAAAGRVDHGHRPPATGLGAVARYLRRSQRSARHRVRFGVGCHRDRDRARGRRHTGRMELMEGSAAPISASPARAARPTVSAR